jgi:hypothetical protein
MMLCKQLWELFFMSNPPDHARAAGSPLGKPLSTQHQILPGLDVVSDHPEAGIGEHRYPGPGQAAFVQPPCDGPQ